jgi:ankyrin repeat protein
MRPIDKIAAIILIQCTFALSHAQDVFLASYNGDLGTVKRLVNENPGLVNSRNPNGRFPLEMAAQTGQTEIVRFLLERGADVHMNRSGATALHMAALYGGKTELIILLLENGADMNARTANGDTPLNLAVLGKQKAIAELLLDKRAEINLENQNFTRLLNIAASGGIGRIADIALKHEIDFSFRTETGNTLLHSAAEGGMAELTELLLSKGLSVETANIYGQTPLHIAARSGHKSIVELFLMKGADANVKMRNGKTPLHLAKEKGHDDVVELLKRKGADASEWTFPKLTGKYLDQSPPGESPTMFAPGIVSAEEHFEHSCLAFSPDYAEVYWSTDFTELGFYDIVYMRKENDRWSAPKLAPFSEKHHAGSPIFSCDGQELYFSSTRPRDENAGNSDGNIWVVERKGKGWSEPRPLGNVINTEKNESVLSISREGTLYFRRDAELFSSKQKSGHFQTPVKLDVQLSAGTKVLALFIDPDERYMIMESFGGGDFGGGDLYVSYRSRNGSWSVPANLGPRINTAGHERFPSVTPDGKYLFFCRVSDGSDFYWVDARSIDDLKPREL